MEWDLQQRLQEIAELQKDLSETQLFLTEERRRFMKVVAENDELRGMNREFGYFIVSEKFTLLLLIY